MKKSRQKVLSSEGPIVRKSIVRTYPSESLSLERPSLERPKAKKNTLKCTLEYFLLVIAFENVRFCTFLLYYYFKCTPEILLKYSKNIQKIVQTRSEDFKDSLAL